MPRHLPLAAAALVLGAGAGVDASAQELPLRRYGVRDGLVLERVSALHQDRRGFLWIGTSEGLSRFDGARFVTFGPEEGLTRPQVTDVAEDAAGRLWVGTNSGGVAYLDAGAGRFVALSPGPERASRIVGSVAVARDGAVWCASESGIHRGEERDGEWRFTLERAGPALATVLDGTPEGAEPWFLAPGELLEVRGRALVAHASPIPGEIGTPSAAASAEGGRWVVAAALGAGELELPSADRAARWTPLDVELPGVSVRAVLRDPDGTVWVATLGGLVRARDGRSELLGVEHGLPDGRISALCRDREGNLWIGTLLAGLARLAPLDIVNVGRASGLLDPYVLRVVEAADGRVYVASERGGLQEIAGGRAVPVRGAERVPRVGLSFLQARDGSFWAGDRERLLHARGPALDLATARELGPEHGWPEGAGVYGELGEDASGTVWLSQYPSTVLWTCAPDAASGVERCAEVPSALDVPPVARSVTAAADGVLWIGSWTGLWRVEPGGPGEPRRVREVVPAGGWPDPVRNVQAVHVDRRGRLWIGTRFAGAGVTDEPAAESPRFRFVTRGDGLPSDSVWAIAEDLEGNLVLGTGQGAAVLDAEGRVLERLGAAEGLAGDLVNDVLCARDGRIWLATSGGVSILDRSVPSAPPPPPPIHVERVLAGGAPCALGPDRVDLAPDQSRVRIEFQGIALSGGRTLAYEHRLIGLDDGWSEPGEARFVEYAELPPGRYRFEVRARLASGVVSPVPAAVELSLAAPLWRRSWFAGACAAALGALAYAAHRVRVARVLALERLRTQIAGDLHDDIGAGLSEIAVLSEVARRGGDGERTFGLVAERARELRASMGDLVWSVDPRRDRVPDLVQRLREHATRVTEAEGLELAFDAAPGLADTALGLAPDRRRHVLLAFQEALHNVCRHARATRVEVALALADGALVLSVADDGAGFDPDAARHGHGLASLRRRARLLGGRLELHTAPDAGTRVVLACPLRVRRRRSVAIHTERGR